MKNIAVKIMYDGAKYHGWQFQKNGITVQERIETVLSKLTNEKELIALIEKIGEQNEKK